MSPRDIGKTTKTFFDDNKVQLEKSYPGFNLNILKRELFQFAHRSKIYQGFSEENFFSAPYLKNGQDPVEYFFSELRKGIPIEYITGRSFFYKSEFSVNSEVLIPRSESERLVEMGVEVLKDWSKKTDEALKMADVGTGSGAIILSTIREMDRPVLGIGTDIHLPALKVAKKNYFNLRYTLDKHSDVHFIHTDRLKEVEEKFHLILSNPPYIKKEEDKDLVHEQVDAHEPHVALYLNDQTYDEWFTELFKQVGDHLLHDGIFIMEGHEHHLPNLEKLAKAIGLSDVKLINDYNQLPRYLYARKKEWIN